MIRIWNQRVSSYIWETSKAEPPRATTKVTPPAIDRATQWQPDSAIRQDHRVSQADFQETNPISQFASPEITTHLPEENFEAVEPSDSEGWTDHLKQKFAGADIQKMLASLAVVLGGYFGFVWLWRRVGPGGSGGLPTEVLEIVGQTPFGPKKTLQLVRLGTRLLLLLNSPEGTHPIGEITDPAEVDHITTVCSGRGYRGASEKRTVFNNLVQQVQKRENPQPRSRQETTIGPPQVIASSLPQQSSQPSSTTNGELERILKTLTQAVRQVQHQNEFEA